MTSRKRTRGFTLIEVLVAMTLLMLGLLSFAGIFATAASTTHSEADLTEAVAVCESKMEELRTLDFSDTTTDTTQVTSQGTFPTTGGTGLAAGGSTTQPVAGYVDYLDSNGTRLQSATGAIYKRMWQIQDTMGANANEKLISVHCVDIGSASRSPLRPDLKIETQLSQ